MPINDSAPVPAKKFKVEMLFGYGWDDAGWTVDDQPQRFDTEAEAHTAITEFVAESKKEAERGHLEAPYVTDEFQVVEADD